MMNAHYLSCSKKASGFLWFLQAVREEKKYFAYQ